MVQQIAANNRPITTQKFSYCSFKWLYSTLKSSLYHSPSKTTVKHKTNMCRSRKYPYSPHRRDWNFLGGGRFCKTKKFKEMCEALLEFPEGCAVLEKIPSMGEVWVFS